MEFAFYQGVYLHKVLRRPSARYYPWTLGKLSFCTYSLWFEVLVRHCEILWDTVRPRKTLQDTSRTHLNHSTTLTHGICLLWQLCHSVPRPSCAARNCWHPMQHERTPVLRCSKVHWSQPQDGGVTSELELGQHVNTHKAANQSQSQHVSTQCATNVWTSTRNMFRHFGISNKQRLSLGVYVGL